ATVATVYSIEPHPRTAEAIMGVDAEQTEKPKKPRARNKRVWAKGPVTDHDVDEDTDYTKEYAAVTLHAWTHPGTELSENWPQSLKVSFPEWRRIPS
ncbi:MAG: hypothetical protein ACREYF_20290, partial [Gammaproteobacteria bacterium]